MSKRQKEWARRVRDQLFDILGRRCAYCGAVDDLEFDCIIPPGDDRHHRQLSWDQRMSFYRRQHEQNNLQVLCSHCNGAKRNEPF